MKKFLLWILAACLSGEMIAAKDSSDCPVCIRVIKATRELSKSGNMPSMSMALDKYCAISTLEVEDQQFCYNIENVRADINRVLDIGADEFRVCKKVKAMNPHFCSSSDSKKAKKSSAVHLNENHKKRGVINI